VKTRTFMSKPTNKPFVDRLVLTEFPTDESKKPKTSQPCAPQLLSASIRRRPRINCTFGAVMRRHWYEKLCIIETFLGGRGSRRQLSAPSAKTEVLPQNASVNNSNSAATLCSNPRQHIVLLLVTRNFYLAYPNLI
jgi:hypothetical protein